VVLRHPVTLVAERLDVTREVERIAQRLTGIAAFGDRGKIENGEWDHRMTIAPYAPGGKRLLPTAIRQIT
jgi:hypothetical protein